MTFTGVLLICLLGIAACTLLVFLVETLVAFCFETDEKRPHVTVPLQMPTRRKDNEQRKAA